MIPAGAALALRFVRSPEISAGDDPEFARVLRIAAVSSEGAATFFPEAGLGAEAWLAAWEQWRGETFREHLAPAMEAAAGFAARGQAREIRDADAALSAALPAGAAARSAAAGLRLYEAMSGVRGERWFNKLQAWAADGTMAAHFPIAYACRYASFHLPGRLLLPTYAHWEWTAALAARPPADGTLPDFAAVTPAASPSEGVRRAFSVD